MAYELLTLERRDDGVAVVTLANGKVNPLSRELLTPTNLLPTFPELSC
jgi:hypothetical protein